MGSQQFPTQRLVVWSVRLGFHGKPSAGESGLHTLHALKPVPIASSRSLKWIRLDGSVLRPGGQSGRQ